MSAISLYRASKHENDNYYIDIENAVMEIDFYKESKIDFDGEYESGIDHYDIENVIDEVVIDLDERGSGSETDLVINFDEKYGNGTGTL